MAKVPVAGRPAEVSYPPSWQPSDPLGDDANFDWTLNTPSASKGSIRIFHQQYHAYEGSLDQIATNLASQLGPAVISLSGPPVGFKVGQDDGRIVRLQLPPTPKSSIAPAHGFELNDWVVMEHGDQVYNFEFFGVDTPWTDPAPEPANPSSDLVLQRQFFEQMPATILFG